MLIKSIKIFNKNYKKIITDVGSFMFYKKKLIFFQDFFFNKFIDKKNFEQSIKNKRTRSFFKYYHYFFSVRNEKSYDYFMQNINKIWHVENLDIFKKEFKEIYKNGI